MDKLGMRLSGLADAIIDVLDIVQETKFAQSQCVLEYQGVGRSVGLR